MCYFTMQNGPVRTRTEKGAKFSVADRKIGMVGSDHSREGKQNKKVGSARFIRNMKMHCTLAGTVGTGFPFFSACSANLPCMTAGGPPRLCLWLPRAPDTHVR